VGVTRELERISLAHHRVKRSDVHVGAPLSFSIYN
jgi:hypothetical protein